MESLSTHDLYTRDIISLKQASRFKVYEGPGLVLEVELTVVFLTLDYLTYLLHEVSASLSPTAEPFPWSCVWLGLLLSLSPSLLLPLLPPPPLSFHPFMVSCTPG